MKIMDERHIPSFCNFSQAINRFSSHSLLPRSIKHVPYLCIFMPIFHFGDVSRRNFPNLSKSPPKWLNFLPFLPFHSLTSVPVRRCRWRFATFGLRLNCGNQLSWGQVENVGWQRVKDIPGFLSDSYQIGWKWHVSNSFLKETGISRRFSGTTLDIGGRDMSPQRPTFQLNLFERNPAKFIVRTFLFPKDLVGWNSILGICWVSYCHKKHQKTTYLEAESIFYGYIYIYIYM